MTTYKKEYYQKNKERIYANQKRYHLKHREEIKEYKRKYYLEHREKYIAQFREKAITHGQEGYREFILDRLDESKLTMFDDILINREIAEIEVRIKFKRMEEK